MNKCLVWVNLEYHQHSYSLCSTIEPFSRYSRIKVCHQQTSWFPSPPTVQRLSFHDDEFSSPFFHTTSVSKIDNCNLYGPFKACRYRQTSLASPSYSWPTRWTDRFLCWVSAQHACSLAYISFDGGLGAFSSRSSALFSGVFTLCLTAETFRVNLHRMSSLISC